MRGLYIFKYGVIREGLSENVTFQDEEEPALKRARWERGAFSGEESACAKALR